MIALQMRANGYSPEAVMATIMHCAPQIRAENQRRRDWQGYAARTINYAFGYAGDRDLHRYERYLVKWAKIENASHITGVQTDFSRLQRRLR